MYTARSFIDVTQAEARWTRCRTALIWRQTAWPVRHMLIQPTARCNEHTFWQIVHNSKHKRTCEPI